MSVFIGYPSFMAYQMMKGKKDNNDGFPTIPGTIARYSALGLTNEQMAANPVWVDKTGNGHDLQMKNFLWAGMSGVGGYVYKWNILSEWILYSENATAELTSSTIHVTEAKTANPFLERKSKTGGYSKMEIKVTGIKDGEILKFMSDLDISNRIEIKKDGIYSLPGSSKEYYGFRLSNSTNTYPFNCDITIEQLPLYSVKDDCGVCDNFPILTKEKGYTVVALRQWISMGEGISGLVSNVKNWFNDGAFVLEYNSNNATNKFVNRPVSFGKVNIEMDLPNNFTYQTSKSYKGVPITTGSFKGTNSLFVGKLNNIIGNCSNVAIWELVFLDHDATEEELTKIKDYFIKTYPWLFPDQAWTVTGKTNEDEDRATIANITGNGNNLVLSNFGFAEGSGYNEEGEYAGYLVTDGVDDKVQSSSFTMNEDWTIVGDWELLSNVQINCGIVKAQNVYLYNIANGLLISINNPRSLQSFGTKSLHAICSDGRLYDRNWVEYEYTVDQNFAIVKSSLNIGFNLNNYTQIAFKNLGIYNNQILSKEDCIKAYNYLQTLKAK